MGRDTNLSYTSTTVKLRVGWKKFLTIEPFVSILVTFGGIYVIWLGYPAMAYLVMLSGFLMTLSYIGGIIAVLSALNKKPLTASSIKG